MLPPFLDQVFKKVRHPHPIYLVGGPVRDTLLQRPCHDWDFACKDARAAARRVQRSLKARFITLDAENRIYRLMVRTSTQGERLTVDFAELVGGTIEKDLGRRDFTMNAMAVQLGRDRIIDPFNGQRALRLKRVVMVSGRVFREDPLRLVRAFRLSAQLGFKMDSKIQRAVRKNAGRLKQAAPERIREEFLRLLSEPLAANTLTAMDRSGLLTLLIPELETCRRCAVRYYGKGGVLRHSLQTVGHLDWIVGQIFSVAPSTRFPVDSLVPYLRELVGGFPRVAWLRLGALLHDVGKPATAQLIKGRLRFFGHEEVGAGLAHARAVELRCSRQESQLIRLWVRHHMRPGNLAAATQVSDKAIARFFRDLGKEGVGMLLVSLADHYDYLPKSQWGKGKDPVEELIRKCLVGYYTERQKIVPPRIINGHLLMRVLKLKPGPLIGKLLEAIQDAQAEGKVKSKEEALACAQKIVGRQNKK